MTAKDRSFIELRNGATRIVIDAASGSIVRIENANTGAVHVDATRNGRKDARLFRIMIPGDFWWSRCADAQEQTQVICTEADGGVVLRYPDLQAADGSQTGVAAQVDIRPSDRKDEFTFVLKLENRGACTVIDTAFPLLGGWQERGQSDRFAMGANAMVNPRVAAKSVGNNYARNGRRHAAQYPVGMACPWVDMSGPDGGLAYVNYMTEARNGRFWFEDMDGYGSDFRLALGWVHLIAIPPGESWTSPPIGLTAHEGDWHVTADRYNQWFDAHHPPDYSRPAVRSRIGFQNVFFRGFDGTPIRSLDRLPAVAAAGRQFGVDMLCVWDTLTLGNYARHNPQDLADYSAEEHDSIRRGLLQAERDGTGTCALINFRHPNVGLHLPDPDLVNRVQKRFTGTFTTENWAANHTIGDLWSRHIGPESYVFSPFSKAHRERVLRLTKEYLRLGYTSMFYDQPFEYSPDYGFMQSGHAPEMTHHAALQLVKDVRKLLLAKSPNAVVIGEESDILATPYIDQWMSWSISDPSPALIERMSLMRYSIPHTILSWVVDHEPERAALAFAFGMQLCLMVHGAEETLESEPRFGEQVRELAKLRKATAGRTVMARFRGQNGLSVDAGDGFVACAYESAAGPAVIVAAAGDSAKGTVKVDRSAFVAPGSGSAGVVHQLDGTTGLASGDTREFDLAANEVAVWVL
jgi:hypothetical protein